MLGTNLSTIATSSTASKGVGLLDLPPELRNKIYHLVLIYPVPIEIYYRPPTWIMLQEDLHHYGVFFIPAFDVSPRSTEVIEVRIAAPLLRVCKQIHMEATPILYGGNSFKGYCSTIYGFLSVISGSVQHLRQVAISEDSCINSKNSHDLQMCLDKLRGAKRHVSLNLTAFSWYKPAPSRRTGNLLAQRLFPLARAFEAHGRDNPAFFEVVKLDFDQDCEWLDYAETQQEFRERQEQWKKWSEAVRLRIRSLVAVDEKRRIRVSECTNITP